jgi:pimeloyl-ACP methyl ester carboxylesterase
LSFEALNPHIAAVVLVHIKTMKIIVILALILLSPQLLRAEPITLETPSGTLYGTLEMPKRARAFPVALILAGSGATNRDGDTLSLGGENDSLRLLAEGLAAHGIASVRYDKRGVAASAQSGLKEADLRFENYIDDAVLWGKKLQSDRKFSRLIIIGHSEGSLIGMVAAKNLHADAFVTISGAGRAANQVLIEQLKLQLPPDLMKKSEEIVQSLVEGKTIEEVPDVLNSLFRPSVQPYLSSWFHYDPAKEIEKLSMPVLIVQGTTDLQVSVQDAMILSTAKPSAKLCIVEGMNHVLKSVSGDREKQMRSYIDPALPVSPKLILETSRFIKKLKKR